MYKHKNKHFFFFSPRGKKPVYFADYFTSFLSHQTNESNETVRYV